MGCPLSRGGRYRSPHRTEAVWPRHCPAANPCALPSPAPPPRLCTRPSGMSTGSIVTATPLYRAGGGISISHLKSGSSALRASRTFLTSASTLSSVCPGTNAHIPDGGAEVANVVGALQVVLPPPPPDDCPAVDTRQTRQLGVGRVPEFDLVHRIDYLHHLRYGVDPLLP